MPNAPPKTQKTAQSADEFLQAIPDQARRVDCLTLRDIMARATNAEPHMWGPSIVGFGDRHYRYESGREGHTFIVGFSPRKGDLTLYLSTGFPAQAALMAKLGKHKVGKACVYIKRLSDVNLDGLTELIEASVRHATEASAGS